MYHHQKIVKQDPSPYVVFNPSPYVVSSATISSLQDRGRKELTIMSIDVGIKNLAIRIETRKRRINFASSTEVELYFFCLYNLSSDGETTGTSNINPSVLIVSIEEMKELLRDCPNLDLIVVERQLPVNVKSTRMYQHLITILLLHIHEGKINREVLLVDVSPSLKYTQLGCPPHLNKQGKKLWGITEAERILNRLGDSQSIDIMESGKKLSTTKADDLADTVTQIQAILERLNL